MKFGDPVVKTYGEVVQQNPIRWELLYKEEDTYIPQSAQFKCKDFFNDLVGWYKGVKVSIYSFDTNSMKLNDDGVWIRVHNIKWPMQWLTNVENVVQKPLEAALGVRLDITLLDLATYLIFIPKRVFESTYHISLLTYLIRVSNNDYLYETMEQVFTDNNGPAFFATKENSVPTGIKAKLARSGFVLPEKFADCWYYADASYNSQKDTSVLQHYISILHNNGMCNWARHF